MATHILEYYQFSCHFKRPQKMALVFQVHNTDCEMIPKLTFC